MGLFSRPVRIDPISTRFLESSKAQIERANSDGQPAPHVSSMQNYCYGRMSYYRSRRECAKRNVAIVMGIQKEAATWGKQAG